LRARLQRSQVKPDAFARNQLTVNGVPFEFECRSCGETHRGLPAWHFQAPVQALAIAPPERAARVELTEDDCVIDQKEFYLKGLLEIPVQGTSERFVWGIWLSVSAESYGRFAQLFSDVRRPADDQFFGWVCSELPGYPSTQLLKAQLHVREYPMRPWVGLEPTNHPLSLDQRNGLTLRRAMELAESLLHPGHD